MDSVSLMGHYTLYKPSNIGVVPKQAAHGCFSCVNMALKVLKHIPEYGSSLVLF